MTLDDNLNAINKLIEESMPHIKALNRQRIGILQDRYHEQAEDALIEASTWISSAKQKLAKAREV